MNPQPHLQVGGAILFSPTRPNRFVLAVAGLSILAVLGQGTVMGQGWPPPNPYIRTAPYPQSAYAQPSPQSYPQPGYPAQAPAYPGNGSVYSQQDQYGQQGYPQQQRYAQQPQYSQPPNPDQQGYGDPSYAPDNYSQSQPVGQPVAQPLSAEQLEQLVAPIALYPDALVAQVLAAATYPAQVSGADQWRQSMGYASPDQIVAGADAQSWDPSVKALTAFPQVLSMMDRNLQWTTDLGNAYFNQPQDVLQTIQVMRQRAQSAGTLVSSPQEAVSYDQGYIELAPANPQVVYVPAYNPWSAYGQPVTPYSGFSLSGVFGAIGSIGSFVGSSLLHYGPGVAMSAFSSSPWGWVSWALNWLTQSIFFNHSSYSSHSTSVAHWNLGGRGGQYSARGSYGERGGFGDHGSFGRPGERYNRFAGNRPLEGVRPEGPRIGSGLGDSGLGRNPVRPALPGGRPFESLPSRPMPLSRPPQEAFNRLPEPVRPGYGSGFGSRPGEGNGFRSGGGFANLAPVYRGPSIPQHGSFGQPSIGRGFAESGRGFADRGFTGQQFKPEKSGGFHPFGGGHDEKSLGGGRTEFKEPKMPKNFGHERMPKAPHFSEHGHSGGGHSGGGHLFGGHHH